MMNRQIWGVALFALGLLVIADGWLSVIQKNTGTVRWIYTGLGAYLVFRGLYVWWPFRRQRKEE